MKINQEHMLIHKRLHSSLDELSADFISCTGKLLSETTVMELMEWSNGQCTNPTTKPVKILSEKNDK
jgi:hypothetical protein